MTPDKCPGCGTKLAKDMLACPNCPMSFPEDDGTSSSGVNPLKHSPYWNFVMPALFFCAIGATIWYMGMGLFHLGEEGAKSIDEKPNFLRTVAEEKKAAADAAAEKASGQTSEGAVFQPADGVTGPSSVMKKGDKPGDETTVISITPVDPSDGHGHDTRPPAPPPTEWKLRGHIYDLATLTPLAGVTLELVDEQTNTRRKTRTSADGLYRVIVPALSGGGYTVSVTKNGYSANYLDPATPAVRELSPADRRSLAKNLTATLTATPVTVAAEDSAPLVTDFYLAPRP